MAAMGLPVGFNTTKGTHVEGNDDVMVADVVVRRARELRIGTEVDMN